MPPPYPPSPFHKVGRWESDPLFPSPPPRENPHSGAISPNFRAVPPPFWDHVPPQRHSVWGGVSDPLPPPSPHVSPMAQSIGGGGSQPLPPRLLKIPILGPILLFLGPFLPILDPPHPHFFGKGPPLNSPPSNIAAHGAPFGDGGSRFMSLPHAPRLNCWFFLGGGGS